LGQVSKRNIPKYLKLGRNIKLSVSIYKKTPTIDNTGIGGKTLKANVGEREEKKHDEKTTRMMCRAFAPDRSQSCGVEPNYWDKNEKWTTHKSLHDAQTACKCDGCCHDSRKRVFRLVMTKQYPNFANIQSPADSLGVKISRTGLEGHQCAFWKIMLSRDTWMRRERLGTDGECECFVPLGPVVDRCWQRA